MVFEIKLYLITKYFYIFLDDSSKIKMQLENMFGRTIDWKRWMERYQQIDDSKPTQILLMRNIGFTYRQIQKIVNVSPITIQQSLAQYNLDYIPLRHVETISQQLEDMEYRAKKEGLQLW